MAMAQLDSRHNLIMLDARFFHGKPLLDRLPTPTGDASPLLTPPTSRGVSRSASLRSNKSSSPLSASEPSVEIEIATPGEKTNSFFGSPFSSSTPTPAPPLHSAPRHSLPHHETRSNTAPLLVPQSRRAVSESKSTNPPGATLSTSPSHSHYSQPPSSDEHRLPPIARFFPSRVSGDPKRIGEDWSSEYVSLSRSSSLGSTGGFRRDFFSIPTDSVPSAPPTVVSDLSRSSTRSSGFTNEFPSFDGSPPSSNEPAIVTAAPAADHGFELITPSAPVRHGSHASKAAYLTELRREVVAANPTPQPKPGTVIGTADVPLTLIRLLGQGAFSSVWLARDTETKLCMKPVGRKFKRRRSESEAKQKKDDAVHGLKPIVGLGESTTREVLHELDGDGPILDVTVNHATINGEINKTDRVVAVKMMDRALCDVNDRTRISFIREVEVLRHISHPCIVSYLQSFTTPTHHCLVLEAIQGGELFELLNSDDNHSRMTEPLLRKMWCELCRAVGWMHGVALVHRDIKLENILLTYNPFSTPGEIDLTKLPTPLVKLTDFGLARFIDPTAPLLTTRCGSESYAAPEIVIGSKYDGRQTDAWACGVVLYALATRAMPFDRQSVGSGSSSGDGETATPSAPARETRRSYLMRIAKGEYSWPSPSGSDDKNDPARLATDGIQRVVGKLLVREASKRATIVSLWSDEWMKGEGGYPGPLRTNSSSSIPIEEEDGDLLDGETIASVAMEELV